MIVINEQLVDFSTAANQKIKKAFLEKHGIDENNISYEFRRNPEDFFMQENENGDKNIIKHKLFGLVIPDFFEVNN